MKQRPAGLADYRKPPIDEVAIAVQFTPIENLSENDIRRYWHEVQDDYPLAESQPRLEGPIESLDPNPVAPVLQIPLGLPLPGRLWLISHTDDFLVQVQNTRFIQNWRRREARYEHFERIHELFWANFRKFRTFLDNNGFQQPSIQQAEVTYINWLPNASPTDFLRLASAAKIHISDIEREPQDQSWSARYLIPNDLNMVQRLYAQCQPAVRTQPPHAAGTQFSLVFRSARLEGIDDAQVEAAIDFGRIVIVEAFTELTTEPAQAEWERFQ